MQIDDEGRASFPVIRLRRYDLTLVGPFQNEETMRSWANKNLPEDYSVVYMTPPSEFTSAERP